ncbi:MAG: c-type cytochrome [Gammaproteobacteria bacterium]|nr:c-type cytochrome [Gammaproteobacteria bacterium]MDH3511993.1 c-type cytochrome [Gammaproteobacteria bacterium]
MRIFYVLQLIIFVAVLATGQAMAGADVKAGEELAASCAGCHGSNGEGSGEYGAIAGWDVERFKSTMQAYKSGENDDPMMAMMVQALSDEDIASLAEYYASL